MGRKREEPIIEALYVLRERERKKQVLGRAERALLVKVGTVLGSVGS